MVTSAISHPALIQHIRAEMTAHGGAISFARYMELALYAPGLGYYSAGLPKLGVTGDFITAPEISPLFSRCIARQCQQVLQTLGGGVILELGAGTGAMAADLLLELQHNAALPEQYLILEVSAELKQRQQQTLQQRMPQFFDRIHWLDRLPDKPVTGVVLANEVLDAMPVQRFRLDAEGLHEFYVTWNSKEFVWQLAPPSTELQATIQNLQIEVESASYESEISLMIPAWIKSISAGLHQGCIILLDYGYPQHEFYHRDRYMGTLMCHYQHRAHPDPLCLTGLQDITAHVNFTQVAEAAVANDLQVAGFTTQAAFLLGCGLLDLVKADDLSVRAQLEWSQQIQRLTAPQEMGELFKAIALTRGLDNLPLLGFSLQDQRQRL